MPSPSPLPAVCGFVEHVTAGRSSVTVYEPPSNFLLYRGGCLSHWCVTAIYLRGWYMLGGQQQCCCNSVPLGHQPCGHTFIIIDLLVDLPAHTDFVLLSRVHVAALLLPSVTLMLLSRIWWLRSNLTCRLSWLTVSLKVNLVRTLQLLWGSSRAHLFLCCWV